MIKDYDGHKPSINPTAYISENALIIGKVFLGPDVSIWPGVVLRGDVEDIIVNDSSNLQDGTLVHTNYNQATIIGKGVTVGHGAILHGCRVGDNCLIGMGAIILNGAIVGDNCLIAAGALVKENEHVPEGVLVAGVPGRIARKLTEDEIEKIRSSAQEYKNFAAQHRNNSKAIE